MLNKLYIRCMGGKFCGHTPGTCTASAEYQNLNQAEQQRTENPMSDAPAAPTLGERLQDLIDYWAPNPVADGLKAARDHIESQSAEIARLGMANDLLNQWLTAANARNARLSEILREAGRQLAYLDERWPTGTTPAVIACIDAALLDAQPEQGVEK